MAKARKDAFTRRPICDRPAAPQSWSTPARKSWMNSSGAYARERCPPLGDRPALQHCRNRPGTAVTEGSCPALPSPPRAAAVAHGLSRWPANPLLSVTSSDTRRGAGAIAELPRRAWPGSVTSAARGKSESLDLARQVDGHLAIQSGIEFVDDDGTPTRRALKDMGRRKRCSINYQTRRFSASTRS